MAPPFAVRMQAVIRCRVQPQVVVRMAPPLRYGCRRSFGAGFSPRWWCAWRLLCGTDAGGHSVPGSAPGGGAHGASFAVRMQAVIRCRVQPQVVVRMAPPLRYGCRRSFGAGFSPRWWCAWRLLLRYGCRRSFGAGFSPRWWCAWRLLLRYGCRRSFGAGFSPRWWCAWRLLCGTDAGGHSVPGSAPGGGAHGASFAVRMQAVIRFGGHIGCGLVLKRNEPDLRPRSPMSEISNTG